MKTEVSSKEDVASVLLIMGVHMPPCSVLRAKGAHKPGSDIGVVLKGKELTLQDLIQISLSLDDLLLPYAFDLSLYHRIDNANLLAHIGRVGKNIFRKQR